MSEDSRPPARIRARGRSFLALVLSPEAPLDAWLDGLDHQIDKSAQFFAGKPVILDLGLLGSDDAGLSGLYEAVCARGVRVIGIEGGDPQWPALAGWDAPAGFAGGRASGAVDIPEDEASTEEVPTLREGSLILEQPVRSGQSVLHPDGDVIIVGSVASGAEVTAGGSIHVYGTLRGRAVAGIGGTAGARIFASAMRAELLAIDGFYVTAEEIDSTLLGKPAQARLEDDRIVVQGLGGGGSAPGF